MRAIEELEKAEAESAESEAERMLFDTLNAKHGPALDAMSKAELVKRVSRLGYRLQKAFGYRPASPIVRLELLKVIDREAAGTGQTLTTPQAPGTGMPDPGGTQGTSPGKVADCFPPRPPASQR